MEASQCKIGTVIIADTNLTVAPLYTGLTQWLLTHQNYNKKPSTVGIVADLILDMLHYIFIGTR